LFFLISSLLFISSSIIPGDWNENRPIFSDELYESTWKYWIGQHKKQYDPAEENYRFRVFQKNMDFVAKHNSEEHSFTVDLNRFADLPNCEFLEKYTGFRRTVTIKPDEVMSHVVFNSTQALPASWDWRSYGAVTPVKDQGQCGSCWSFSVTGTIEGAWQIAKGKLVSLSEQNLMDCSWSYGNMACNGGLEDTALQYVIDNGGIDTEASYPYTAKSSRSCKYSAANSGAKISSYVQLKKGDESALQTAVATKCPISVAIDASHNSFQLYKSGVYYEPKCSSVNLDHAVLTVGYGTETVGGDYWLVKNSWGTSWGMQGYIEMARNENNNCGIASDAMYPVV